MAHAAYLSTTATSPSAAAGTGPGPGPVFIHPSSSSSTQNPNPSLRSRSLSLPFSPLPWSRSRNAMQGGFCYVPPSDGYVPRRKLKKLAASRKSNTLVEAIYSSESSVFLGSARNGIWSIRDDVQISSSPYFPTYAQGQGPPPMVQERFQSVISQLFQYRIIRCGGAVDDDMANIIVAQLLYLDAIDPNKDIVIYVNSPGGSVTAGMAIFDTMRHIRPDVSTVCVGLAASMGAFLLSAGTKGKCDP